MSRAATAIERNRRDAGFDIPVHHGVARTVLDELTRNDTPAPTGELPFNLDCYLAIRRTAHKPRWGGRQMDRAASARGRGAVDVAIIGLTRDSSLRVRGGPGPIRVVSQ